MAAESISSTGQDGPKASMDLEQTAILNWQMTSVCNFDCHYCFGHKRGEKAASIPAAKVISCLQSTGRNWQVNLVGGEVMLIPDFLQTCAALHDAGMRISIETNLSLSDRAAEFSKSIDPSKVECVQISAHIEEREKRNGVERLLRDIVLLRNKGFNLYVNYVLHPSLFPRFQADYDRFAAIGVALKPAPYIGQYDGALYPEAYTNRQRKILLKANPKAGTYTGLRTRGMLCRAGRDFALLDSDVFFRCNAFIGKLGTIQQGIKLYDEARVCPIQTCPCWGYRFLVDREKAEKLARRFEKSSLHVALKANAATGPFYRTLCQFGGRLSDNTAVRTLRKSMSHLKGRLKSF